MQGNRRQPLERSQDGGSCGDLPEARAIDVVDRLPLVV